MFLSACTWHVVSVFCRLLPKYICKLVLRRLFTEIGILSWQRYRVGIALNHNLRSDEIEDTVGVQREWTGERAPAQWKLTVLMGSP